MRLKLFTKFTAALYELQREMINVSFSKKVNSKTIISSLHMSSNADLSLFTSKIIPYSAKSACEVRFLATFLLVSPLLYHKIPTIFGELLEPLNHCRCYCIVFLRHCIYLLIPFLPRMVLSPVACSRTDYTGNYIIKISWLVLRLLKGLIVNQNFEIQILRYQWVLSLPLQKAWFNNVPRFDFNNVTINLIPCQTFSLDTFNSIEVVTTYSQIKFNTSVNTREIRPEWSPFKLAFSFSYPWWLRLILRVKK